SNDKLAASERRRAGAAFAPSAGPSAPPPRLKLRRPSRFESPLGELAGRGCSCRLPQEEATVTETAQQRLSSAALERPSLIPSMAQAEGSPSGLLSCRCCCCCCWGDAGVPRLLPPVELRILHQRHFFSLLLFLLLIDALRAEGHLGRLFLKLDLLRLLLVLCNSALCTTPQAGRECIGSLLISKAADDSPAVSLVSVSSPLATGFSSTMELLRLLLELLELPEPLEPPPASLAAFSFSAARLSAVWMASSCSAGIRRREPSGGTTESTSSGRRNSNLLEGSSDISPESSGEVDQLSVAARAPHTSVMVLGLLLSSSDTSGPLTEVAWGQSNLVGLVRLVGGAVPGQGLQPDAVHSAGRQPRRLQAAVAGQPHAAVGDAVDQQAVPRQHLRQALSQRLPENFHRAVHDVQQLHGRHAEKISDGWRFGATAMARMKTMPGLRSFSGSQVWYTCGEGAGRRGLMRRSASPNRRQRHRKQFKSHKNEENFDSKPMVTRKQIKDLKRFSNSHFYSGPVQQRRAAVHGVEDDGLGVAALEPDHGSHGNGAALETILGAGVRSGSGSTSTEPQRPGAPTEATQNMPGRVKVYRKLPRRLARPLLNDWSPFAVLGGACSGVGNFCVGAVAASRRLTALFGGFTLTMLCSSNSGASPQSHSTLSPLTMVTADGKKPELALSRTTAWSCASLTITELMRLSSIGASLLAPSCRKARLVKLKTPASVKARSMQRRGVRPWVVDRSDHRVGAEAGGAHLHLVHPAGGAALHGPDNALTLCSLSGRCHTHQTRSPLHTESFFGSKPVSVMVMNPPPLTLGPGAAMSVDDARLFGALFSLKCWMAAWLGVTIRAPMLAKASCAESSSCWHWPSSQPSPELSDSPPARLQQVWREAICRQLHPVLLRLHLHDDGADVGGRLLVVEVRVVEHPRLQEVVVLLHWNQTRSPAFTTRMAGSKLRSVISTRCSLEFEFNCGGKMRYKLLTELGGRRRYSDCPMVRKLSLPDPVAPGNRPGGGSSGWQWSRKTLQATEAAPTCRHSGWVSPAPCCPWRAARATPVAMDTGRGMGQARKGERRSNEKELLLEAAVHSTVGCLLHEVRHGAVSPAPLDALADLQVQHPRREAVILQLGEDLLPIANRHERFVQTLAPFKPLLEQALLRLRPLRHQRRTDAAPGLRGPAARLGREGRRRARLVGRCGVGQRLAFGAASTASCRRPVSRARLSLLLRWRGTHGRIEILTSAFLLSYETSQASDDRGRDNVRARFRALGADSGNTTDSVRGVGISSIRQSTIRRVRACPRRRAGRAYPLFSGIFLKLKLKPTKHCRRSLPAGPGLGDGRADTRGREQNKDELDEILNCSRRIDEPNFRCTRRGGGDLPGKQPLSRAPRAMPQPIAGARRCSGRRGGIRGVQRHGGKTLAAMFSGLSAFESAAPLPQALMQVSVASENRSRRTRRSRSRSSPQRQRRQRRSVGWSNEAPGQPPSPSSVSPPPSILKAAPPQQPLPQSALLAAGGDQWQSAAATPDSGCSSCLYICSLALIALTFPFSLIFCLRVVAEYERAVVLRLGRVLGQQGKGPGLFFIIPCCDSVRIVDLRTVTFDVPPQEVLTKDSVTVAVDAVVYYRIFSPVVSVTNVEDADRSTRLLAQTTLRNVLGTKNLSEILSEREEISCMMQECLDLATDPWGVKVERVEIKDVRLPVQLQRAMAAEAEAAREARAKVIMAEGEQKASRALREAAVVIQESPFALQLRYLHTLNVISAEKNSTIIFPLPMEFLAHFRTGVSPTAALFSPQSQPEDKEEPQPQQPQRQRRQRRSVGWSNEAPGQPPSPSSVSPPPSILKAAPPQQPLPQSALLAAGGDQWQSAAATPDSGCSSCLYICSLALIALTFPFSLIFCLRVVAEYERAVVLRLGRVLGQQGKGPGLFFIIPCCDSVRIVDLRTVTFDVPPQEVLTKDSVTVAVDAVVYYRIFSPVVSVTNVEDADRSTRLLAQTTLRNVLGTKNLSEILSEREEISCMMQECLDLATDPWGVKVERVEIKDVRLPVQLQRAMAAEAEAAREARAKVIMAEGEQKASRALREAAVVIQESPFALQLRYLHTLNVISAEKNSTIIFPLPMEFLAHFRTGQ
uniref:WD_REPEATS_REGION domain-containing protein n=2 Tax=Protostomia TaxID=33317 RepID=A0A1I8INF3_9PLAT